ncbi:MAG: hypothetical protein ICV64_11870 [Thermoleophilia bacterium]|nr:hypothetical protein [Thermoleophilia bacterium]
MPDLPSGAVTFLFTDIEGSTRLVRQLRGAYAHVLAEHQRLLREAFSRHGGHEVDTQGDAFFYAFPSAHQAVLAAIEGQRALSGYPWPDEASVKVRIGIHTGQAAPVNGRYTGLAVHRAARICAAGHGGQILVSQATQSLLEDEEEDLAVRLADLGDQRLKDIERPVRLYQVAAAGLSAEFPPIRAEEEPPVVAPSVTPLYRDPLVLAAAAGAALVLAAAAALLLRGDSGRLAGVKPNHVGLIEASTSRLVAEVPVGTGPGAIAAADGAVWVANTGDKSVSRIDPQTRTVTKTIAVDATPTGIAVAPDAVWVVHGRLGTVSRIDPQFSEVAATIDAGLGRTSGGSISVGASGVWVAFAAHTAAYVARIEPSSDRIADQGFSADRPSAVAVGEGAVWVANGDDASTVSRMQPETATAIDTITVGRAPRGIAVGHGAVWVANTLDGTVSRVDPKSRSVAATIPVGDEPVSVSAGAGAVWVANAGEGTISRIDPGTNEVTETIELGGRPEGIAAAAGSVWVSVQAP